MLQGLQIYRELCRVFWPSHSCQECTMSITYGDALSTGKQLLEMGFLQGLQLKLSEPNWVSFTICWDKMQKVPTSEISPESPRQGAVDAQSSCILSCWVSFLKSAAGFWHHSRCLFRSKSSYKGSSILSVERALYPNPKLQHSAGTNKSKKMQLEFHKNNKKVGHMCFPTPWHLSVAWKSSNWKWVQRFISGMK